MIGRPSLLLLTAAATALASIANAVGVASPDPAVPQTRLGVAIADDVDARDKTAVRRGRSLDLREQAIRAAEARLKADLETRAAPAGAGAGAPGMVAGGDGAAAPDQFDDLAKIYQAMKPAAAALVLEQLDLDVQMRVAQRMRERSTAMILAAMTPKAAAALTMALARRQAPRPSYVTPAGVKPQVAKR